MNRERILMTGGRGFIGRHALAALIARSPNAEIHATTSQRSPWHRDDRVTWHACNLLDADASAELIRQVQPTHLLHLAWVTTPGVYWTSSDNGLWQEAGRRMCEAFAAVRGRRLVAAGTCAEYDWSAGRCVENETALSSANPYAAAKNQLRADLETIADAHRLSAAWGRVFFAYGPGEPAQRLVPTLIRNLLAGEPAECTAGLHRRDFIHASDLGRAFVELLDSDVSGPVNLGSGRATSIADLANRVGALLGASELVRLGARPTPASEPPLVEADTRRLVSEVGFRPRFDLEAGLIDSIAWWREQERAVIAC